MLATRFATASFVFAESTLQPAVHLSPPTTSQP
jgi:hypothetical protein